jgi:prepilin-type processing-associated H-X9-DG protein
MGRGLDGAGAAEMILGVRERNPPPIPSGSPCSPGPFPYQGATFADPCGHFQFWSPHARGANFAFADGSVRFIRDGIRNTTFAALVTRASGDLPPADDY